MLEEWWIQRMIPTISSTTVQAYPTSSLDSYVAFNYRSGEWTKGTLPQMIACTAFSDTDQAAESLLVSTTTLVRNFDDTSIDDDGTALTRYWTTGWQKLSEEGWLFRILLDFQRSTFARVGVSIAEGFGEAFGEEKVFNLNGEKASQNHIQIIYKLNSPHLVDWINVKVRLIHTYSTAVTKLEKIGFETSSILPTTEKLQRAEAI